MAKGKWGGHVVSCDGHTHGHGYGLGDTQASIFRINKAQQEHSHVLCIRLVTCAKAAGIKKMFVSFSYLLYSYAYLISLQLHSPQCQYTVLYLYG